MTSFDVFTSNVVRERVCRDDWCPVCKSLGAWIDGPRAGMSVNIMCRFCGTRLNVTRELNWVEWTHGPQPVIWGRVTATKFPPQEKADEAREVIEANE